MTEAPKKRRKRRPRPTLTERDVDNVIRHVAVLENRQFEAKGGIDSTFDEEAFP